MNLHSGTFLFCTTQQMGDWAPNGKDKYSNGCFQSDSLRTRSLSTVLHCPLECFSHPKGYKRDQLDPLWAFVEFLRFGFIFFFLQALGDSCTEQSEWLPHCRKSRGARVLECAWLLSCVPPFLPIPCLTVEATCGTIPVCALSHLCVSARPMPLVGVRTYNACSSKAIPASSSVDRIPSLPPSLPFSSEPELLPSQLCSEACCPLSSSWERWREVSSLPPSRPLVRVFSPCVYMPYVNMPYICANKLIYAIFSNRHADRNFEFLRSN